MSLFAELTNSVNAVRPGRTKMRNYDLPLLVASITLVAIGLLMVYSASIALADGPRYANYGRYYFVVRHGLFVAVGLLISSLVLTVPVPLMIADRLSALVFVKLIAPFVVIATALVGAKPVIVSL